MIKNFSKFYNKFSLVLVEKKIKKLSSLKPLIYMPFSDIKICMFSFFPLNLPFLALMDKCEFRLFCPRNFTFLAMVEM